MTTIVTTPKIHHFIQLARTRIEQVKMALFGVPEGLPEYRKAPLPSGTIAYSTMRLQLD